MKSGLVTIDGGVTAPEGFSASGVYAGIKHKKLDVAVLCSDKAASAAGVFTTNAVKAAPVMHCMKVAAGGSARAVVINSGVANACTGEQGALDCAEMAKVTAEKLGVDIDEVFVCSTGTIGVLLPMEKIKDGIANAVDELAPDGGDNAARAIMTTDLVSKQTAVEIEIDGKAVRIGGMSKGSGMIEPNMATMLGFITTDAAVDVAALKKCLKDAADRSFNRIVVDGDESTNDTVLMLANGAAGNEPLNESHAGWPLFVEAVEAVALELAKKIVKDGEGVTKYVTVDVRGAESDADAEKVCRAISKSLLVKTSWFGEDPNWGRIIAAVGYSGAAVDAAKVDIYYDDLYAVKDGCVAGDTAIENLEKILAKKEFSVVVDMKLGSGSSTVYTCDCSYDYVKINSEYTT